MSSKPTAFKDLNAAELYRSAIEDFAVPVSEDDKTKKKVLLAAFAESGVTWADYVAQHPEVAPEPAEQAEQELKDTLRAGGVITSGAPAHDSIEEPVTGLVTVPPVAEEKPVVVVKEEIQVTPNQVYLIKMTRENPLFEVRGYRFTSQHPYALVTPDDAQYILDHEDGFRQATPSELQEYYG